MNAGITFEGGGKWLQCRPTHQAQVAAASLTAQGSAVDIDGPGCVGGDGVREVAGDVEAAAQPATQCTTFRRLSQAFQASFARQSCCNDGPHVILRRHRRLAETLSRNPLEQCKTSRMVQDRLAGAVSRTVWRTRNPGCFWLRCSFVSLALL